MKPTGNNEGGAGAGAVRHGVGGSGAAGAEGVFSGRSVQNLTAEQSRMFKAVGSRLSADKFAYDEVELSRGIFEMDVQEVTDEVIVEIKGRIEKLRAVKAGVKELVLGDFGKGKLEGLGELGIFDIEGVWESVAEEILAEVGKLPDGGQGIAKERYDSIYDMVKYARELVGDSSKWERAAIDKLVVYRLKMRACGITERLPRRLDFTGSISYEKSEEFAAERSELKDEKGIAFGGLRGEGSVICDLARFMDENGGYYSIISKWSNCQGFSGHYDLCMAMKLLTHLRKYGHPKEGAGLDYFLGERTFIDGYRSHLSAYDRAVKGMQLPRELLEKKRAKVVQDSWLMHMAFQMELLDHVDFPGLNREARTVRLYRTESAEVMAQYGVGLSEGVDDVHKIKREVFCSHSIIAPVVVAGAQVTVQDVPFHRIYGNYLVEQVPGKGESAFAHCHQREFLADTSGLPFWSLGSVGEEDRSWESGYEKIFGEKPYEERKSDES